MKSSNKTNPVKEQSEKSTKLAKPTKPSRWAWLAVLLLPIIFYLPLWGEALQVALIGYEGFCCMPENWQKLAQKAEQARSMRLDSNIIIGTGIVLAILTLIGVLYALYKYAIPSIKAKRLRQVMTVVVGVLTAPLATVLSLMLMMFIFYNDEYHSTRYQPPGDYTLYDYTSDFMLLP